MSVQLYMDTIDDGATHVNGAGPERRIVRPFKITGLMPHEVDWGVEGLPNYADPHPVHSFLLAGQINCEEIPGRTGTRGTITYGPFLGTGPLIPNLNFVIFEGTIELVDVGVPFAFKKRVNISDAGESFKDVWDYNVGKITERRTVVEATWIATNIDFAALDAFGSQSNKLHTFGPRQWLFEAGPFRHKSQTQWEMTGRWTLDTGTPRAGLTIEVDIDKIRFPDALQYAPAPAPQPTTELGRLPYHELVVLPPTNPDIEPITLALRQLHDSDPDGWQTLPGSPPL